MKASWTTLAIQSADQVPKHKDSHNEGNTYNYVLELKTESLEGLWVEDRDMERRAVGGANAQDYQYVDADGQSYDGCLVNVTKRPAVFDPLVPHAYVNEGTTKWFLSAYTPQGAYKLSASDQKYLATLDFPLAQVRDDDEDPDCSALETRPVLKAMTLPSTTSLSGARGAADEVEVAAAGE